MAVIEQATEIAAGYHAKGYSMTLRQLYYQFVARGLVENTIQSYKRIGSILNDARVAGAFDWRFMEDRTRNLETPRAWTSPASIISAVASQYQQNPWLDQKWAPQVWVEKEALIGVVEQVCEELRVPYFACRGNVSQSELYTAGVGMRYGSNGYRTPIVFHLGDHDPNGLDMTRDNRDRLELFARREVQVVRLALNMDQIELYNPPPNPAKETDSRYAKYVAEYGDSSWELDALSPEVISDLIRYAVAGITDDDAWAASMEAEERQRELLESASTHWAGVTAYLRGL